MTKQKVELFMDDERQLFVKTKSGEEYMVNVFEGGGYYTALWLQTPEEMEEIARARKESADNFVVRADASVADRKPWWKLWK